MTIPKILNKLLIPIMVIAFIVALNEQEKPQKNVFILIIAIAVFVFGMIKLSAKTPSKNEQNDNENV